MPGLICLRNHLLRIEAEALRAYLEAEGIPVMLNMSDAGGWHTGGFIHSVGAGRLSVRAEDAERAQALLARFDGSAFEVGARTETPASKRLKT